MKLHCKKLDVTQNLDKTIKTQDLGETKVPLA